MTDVVPTVLVKPWQPDQGDSVLLNASEFDATKYELYVPPPPAAPLPPPPPPAAPDPLASLKPDWKSKDVVELKALALAATGRSVENAEQAIAVIEKALKKQAK